ncbi:MAG: site-specific DNA-methyltransferase [Luteitalea sp.]|nr:site-specific DNA-methyltransferase [Luteitalea sp.]
MPVILNPYRIVRARQNSEATFYLADCLEVFRQLAPHSIDVIVTSPPYNMGIRYNTYQDTLTHSDYLEWTGAWVAAAARVLTPEGSLFLNVGTRPSDPWTALDVAQAARSHLRLQNIIHWIKSIAIDQESAGAGAGLTRDLAVGHYKPINSDRFLNDCHEFVFHLTPSASTNLDRLALGVPYQDQSNIARWRAGAEGVRCRGNTWFIPYETIQRRDRDRPHPATFPSRLPEQCLRLHGLDRVGTAMDPFTGLGSTAVACARVGVNFIGAELDEAYLAEAVERVEGMAVGRELPGRGAAKMRKAQLRPAASSKARAASGA